MINYQEQHNKKILSESSTSKGNLRSGDIVRFNYYGKDAHEPRPLVLVLNPNWQGKLHGLALRVISEGKLLELKKIVAETIDMKVQRLIKVRLPKLKTDISNPYKFYHNRLKSYLNTLNENPYRQYITGNISHITRIDYRFQEVNTRQQKLITKQQKKAAMKKIKDTKVSRPVRTLGGAARAKILARRNKS